MELLKRCPVLATLGFLAALEWAVLYGVYRSMSISDQMAIQTSPTIMVWTIIGGFVLCTGLLVILILEAVPPFRPHLPLVIGALLVFALIAGILLPAIAANPTCGCEPS